MSTFFATRLRHAASDDCAAQLLQAECAIHQSIAALLDDFELEDELLIEPTTDILWM